jgi:hypothetical protein
MIPIASFISDFWNDQLVSNSRQGLFLVLVGFLGSFGFIRMSARLMRSPRVPWWPGSVVSDGGVHLHHLVWGISLMIGAGTFGFWFFDTHPWLEICAALFGIGAGLTIDEFALWVYLDDVYWAHEGRSSIDAAVIAATVMGLVLLGFQPFEFRTGSAAAVIESLVGVLIWLGVLFISLAKQRVLHATIGAFLIPLAIYAACRVGKPHSSWAKRFYGERNPGKQAKAEARFAPGRRTERFKERVWDAIGGAPEEEYEAKLAAHAATADAAAEVRRRAERHAAGPSATLEREP